jgi:hypothetical protein
MTLRCFTLRATSKESKHVRIKQAQGDKMRSPRVHNFKATILNSILEIALLDLNLPTKPILDHLTKTTAMETPQPFVIRV